MADNIKKIQIRFDLADEMDSRLWSQIEKQVQQKRGNNYLKSLLLLGFGKEGQNLVLEELGKIRELLGGGVAPPPLKEEKTRQTEQGEKEVKEALEALKPRQTQEETMQGQGEASIDESVMNFLDTL